MTRVELSEIAESIDYGVTAPANINPVGPKFLRITDIQDGSVNWAAVPFCEADDRRLESSRLRAGDIVFARTGATTGKSFLIKTCPSDAVFASYLIRVRPNARVDSSFLAYFFDSPDYWRQISLKAVGAAQPGINSSKLKELEVPLPPLDEQKRIAAILDQVDSVQRKRGESIRRLEDLASAHFRTMFVENESPDWIWRTIGDIGVDIRTGPFGSQLLHSEFVDGGVAVLGIDNAVGNEFCWAERRFITMEKYRSLMRYTVQPGDVLITIMGTCGRCAIVPDDIPLAINTKHLCCITLDRVQALPTFVHAAFLQHPEVLKQLGVQEKGAVMPGLNMGIIKSIKLPIPPLELQKRFAVQTERLSAVRGRSIVHKAKLDTLFASLQHRAFRGELMGKDAERELEMAS